MQIAAQAVGRHANPVEEAAKTGMQTKDRHPLGQVRQKTACLLVGDQIGKAVWIGKLPAKGRIAIGQIAKILTMDQRTALNKNVLIWQAQTLAGPHGQVQPGGIISQHNGRFARHAGGHFLPKLEDHPAVEVADMQKVVPE